MTEEYSCAANPWAVSLPGTFFEKVPFEQFVKDSGVGEDTTQKTLDGLREAWDAIILPHRATEYSAGHDFYLPCPVCLTPGKPTLIPTGVRVKIAQKSWFLMCVPRSGLGFKYGVRLRNGVGIIDADYYNADNYGHIMASVTTEVPLSLKAGDRFMQGIFVLFAVTPEDAPELRKRTGGFGSTGGAG